MGHSGIIVSHCSYTSSIKHALQAVCHWLRADSRLAPSQWEASLQSNAVSHWLGANLESAMLAYDQETAATSAITTRHALKTTNCVSFWTGDHIRWSVANQLGTGWGVFGYLLISYYHLIYMHDLQPVPPMKVSMAIPASSAVTRPVNKRSLRPL